jgi:hypothetical protein
VSACREFDCLEGRSEVTRVRGESSMEHQEMKRSGCKFAGANR